MTQDKDTKVVGIFGDSFGYVKSDHEFLGWVEMLSTHVAVKNFCQCGSSQYRILQTLKSTDLNQFDQLIITHTSPTRVFARHNPLHADNPVYQNCDLLFADVEGRKDSFSVMAQQYFKMLFDFHYSLDVHNMICREIDELCINLHCLHITHFDYTNCYQFVNMINFFPIWSKNRGPVHHYNKHGNQYVFENIINKLGS